MATAILRPSLRTAAVITAGAGLSYTAYKSTSSARTVHAESSPSDTKAALNKVPWKGFTELKLKSAEQVNHNVKKLVFALPADDSITGLSPVTSMLTQHTPEGGWIPVIRPYTPISSGTEPGTITFMVKRYEGGKGSTKMHSLVPGDTIKFKPLEEFKYEPNKHDSILAIAGGSGITPIYQLTNAILSNPEDRTKITLIYANNSVEDILLKSELDALEKRYPGRFKKIFTVSTTSSSTGGGDDDIAKYEKGYVTKELIEKVWPGKKENGQGTKGQKVLVSGPPAMTESIAGAKGMWGWTQGSSGGVLKDLGYSKEDIHKF